MGGGKGGGGSLRGSPFVKSASQAFGSEAGYQEWLKKQPWLYSMLQNPQLGEGYNPFSYWQPGEPQDLTYTIASKKVGG